MPDRCAHGPASTRDRVDGWPASKIGFANSGSSCRRQWIRLVGRPRPRLTLGARRRVRSRRAGISRQRQSRERVQRPHSRALGRRRTSRSLGPRPRTVPTERSDHHRRRGRGLGAGRKASLQVAVSSAKSNEGSAVIPRAASTKRACQRAIRPVEPRRISLSKQETERHAKGQLADLACGDSRSKVCGRARAGHVRCPGLSSLDAAGATAQPSVSLQLPRSRAQCLSDGLTLGRSTGA
jgi:hypothetical protein